MSGRGRSALSSKSGRPGTETRTRGVVLGLSGAIQPEMIAPLSWSMWNCIVSATGLEWTPPWLTPIEGVLEQKENVPRQAQLADELEHLPNQGGQVEAVAVSKALRLMARKASRLGARRRFSEHRRISMFAIVGLVSFLLCVLLPTAFSAVYFGLLASPQYVSQVAFAVRGPTATNDLLGGLSSMVNPERNQDALIVADYIRSQQLVEDLEGDIGLKRRFTPTGLDYFARLKPTASIEDIVLYWQSRVETKIDKNSSVVTVMVKAFTPEDALDIAQAIRSRSERLVNELSERARQDTVRAYRREDAFLLAERLLALSEKLINEISERSRKDSLEQAQSELLKARTLVDEKRAALAAFRTQNEVLDPSINALALGSIIANLTKERLALEAQLSTLKNSMGEDSRTIRTVRTQLATLQDQIRKLEGQLTNPDEQQRA
ncbi:chain length determinant protein, partial [Ostertagia ostertagi]